jgi:mRNA interferase MazF
MRRGEVWWVDFDERRPVVLLSEEEAYGFRVMQVVAPATAAKLGQIRDTLRLGGRE